MDSELFEINRTIGRVLTMQETMVEDVREIKTDLSAIRNRVDRHEALKNKLFGACIAISTVMGFLSSWVGKGIVKIFG